MHRRTVHGRIGALALVTALALLGARPAAAMDLGFLDRLGGLWSAVTGAPEGLWQTLTGWWSGEAKSLPSDGTVNTDQGSGSDPNGNTVVVTAAPTGLPSH